MFNRNAGEVCFEPSLHLEPQSDHLALQPEVVSGALSRLAPTRHRDRISRTIMVYYRSGKPPPIVEERNCKARP
jgi:hypothetical protein